MKIAANFDYDALLDEFQTQWRIKENVISYLSEACYSNLVAGGKAGDRTEKLLRCEIQRVEDNYKTWIAENIISVNLNFEVRAKDKKPIRLIKVLAERMN